MPSAPLNPPSIVLVEPQLGENIGATARAMANFGLRDLRIVRPRDGWPNARARATASGADAIVEAAQIFGNLETALADATLIYATTARPRGIDLPIVGPDTAARETIAATQAGGRVAWMFGRERWGLTNEEAIRAHGVLTLPVEPTFASLNLAQAVLVCAYEWRKTATLGALPSRFENDGPAARGDDMARFFTHLESALDAAGFFTPPEKRPSMVLNLRAIFQKMRLSEREVRILRGVIAGLERGARTKE